MKLKNLILVMLIGMIAFTNVSCSNDSVQKENVKAVNKDSDGYSRLYAIDNRIPLDNVDRKDIEVFTNQLLDKYTIVDKDNVQFLPVDSATIDNESNEALTAKPKVICHKHPYPDTPSIHNIVVLGDNGLYYMVIVYDGIFGWGASTTIAFSSTHNPC